jgi:hypothetical protein
MAENNDFIELLQTNDPTEIEIIKTILKDSGIKYSFRGQALGRIFPSMNKPVRLMVEKGKLELAKKLLKGHGKK